MSTAVQPRPRLVGGKHYYTIVASKFNSDYVQGLVTHASEELRRLAPSSVVSLFQVPGAFEIPVIVREVAMQKKAAAIIAIGVILKGDTSHAENLSRSVTDALQQIAIEHGIPVVNAVLSMESELQAQQRCLEDEINRGTEAARAAVEITHVIADVRARQS